MGKFLFIMVVQKTLTFLLWNTYKSRTFYKHSELGVVYSLFDLFLWTKLLPILYTVNMQDPSY